MATTVNGFDFMFTACVSCFFFVGTTLFEKFAEAMWPPLVCHGLAGDPPHTPLWFCGWYRFFHGAGNSLCCPIWKVDGGQLKYDLRAVAFFQSFTLSEGT